MTLLELLELCKRDWRLIVAFPVVLAIVAAIYCWGFMPNQFTAQTDIYALTTSEATGSTAESISSSDMTASQQLANDFAELASNKQIQLKAAQSIGMDDLTGFDISVKSSTTNRVIKLSVTGTSPASCAVIANALAKEIGATAVDVMGVKAVNVISEAQTPENPSGPNRKMYVAVAFLAGLFLAIALIVLKDMLNTTIRNDDDVVELMGLPVIGHFPTQKGGKR